MTDWDKNQCGAEQGTEWEGVCPPDGGGGPGGPGTGWELPPEPCGQQEIVYATSTPYGLFFEEAFKSPHAKLEDIEIRKLITRGVEDEINTPITELTFIHYQGVNGWGEESVSTDGEVLTGEIFGLSYEGSESVDTDGELTSAEIYGLLYDKAFESVYCDAELTAGTLTAG